MVYTVEEERVWSPEYPIIRQLWPGMIQQGTAPSRGWSSDNTTKDLILPNSNLLGILGTTRDFKHSGMASTRCGRLYTFLF